MGLWDDFSGVFDDVFKTAFGKNSISTTMAFNNVDVARTVANSRAVSQFNGLGRTATKDIKVGKRTIKKGEVVRAGNADDLRNIIKQEGSLSALSGDDVAKYNTLKKYSKEHAVGMGIGDEAFQKFIGREGKDGLGIMGTAKGYFGDSELGSDRIKIAAGGVAGASIAIRHLQGGNMTTTAQGERNIAGIPFI